MNRKEACDFVADIITKDRARTHGEAVTQLANVQQIKRAAGHHVNPHLNDTILEAIDSICIKLSRLANGQPIEDHFLDIMGYAAIAVESLHQEQSVDINNNYGFKEPVPTANEDVGIINPQSAKPRQPRPFKLKRRCRDLENG